MGKKFMARLAIGMQRFFLVLATVVVIVLAAIELTVALHLKVTQILARDAMWLGALSWFLMVVIGWRQRFSKKNEKVPMGFTLFITAIMATSVAGICVATLAKFALWANAALFVMLSMAAVSIVVENWGAMGVTKKIH